MLPDDSLVSAGTLGRTMSEATSDGEGESPETGSTSTRRRGPRGRLAQVFVALAVLVVLLTLGAQLYTEALWFDALGFAGTWWGRIRVQLLLFVVGAVLTAAAIASSLVIAYRGRPLVVPMTAGERALAQYREAVDPFRRVTVIVLPAVLGLLAGLAAAGQWRTYVLWRNGRDTGVTDPQFGHDVSYYLFAHPWWSFVVGFLTALVIGALIAAAFAHYVYGGLQPPSRGIPTRTAFVHISVLAATLAVLRAVSYILDTHALTTQEGEVLTGVGYTGANAEIPAMYILAVGALLCAVLFLVAIRTRSWRLPLISTATLLVLSVAVGGIYPALIENYQVAPSRSSLEEPYLQRNIDSTRAAYGVTDVATDEYDATSTVSSGQLREDAASIPGVRLVDPEVASPTFQQLQAQQPYYTFPESLDVDRYDIDGESTDVVVGARELDLAEVPNDRRDWVNDHTVYTHGYGLVAARGNQVSAGNPQFVDLSAGEEYEPRIYFGEEMQHFSIVGSEEDADPREVDRPSGGEESRYTYTGDGGVAIGSTVRQLAYAITHRDRNFILSDAVGSQSRLLEHRTPRERVQRVAPWLTLDEDPYPTVVDGRIKWVVDGYTTSRSYPYSTAFSMSGVRSGEVSSVQTQQQSALVGDRVNYMRNSVKATVDAYDGSVELYRWDESDPIAAAYDRAFPDLMTPRSEISGDLMSHLRYPEDLFRMQRAVLADYHVTSASDFRAGQDRWRVPNDPANPEGGQAQPPYFLSLAMPDQEQPTWSLTSTYIPNGDRDVMAGYLAVDSDAGASDGEVANGYGALRMLAVPRTTTVPGPGQVQNDIASSNATSTDGGQTLADYLNNNNRGGSQVRFGNQLTLPVGEGFLHVEPIYLQSTSGTSYPQLRVVVVSFGGRVAWAQSLEGALDQLFGGDSGAEAPQDGEQPAEDQEPAGDPTEGLSEQEIRLRDAIADMEQAYEDGQTALEEGDFTAYDEAQQRLRSALREAAENQPEGGSVTLDEDAAAGSGDSATPSDAPTP